MKKLLLLTLALGAAHAAQAQPHFRFTTTDLSHSLFIESASYYGEPLATGNEIGVFTPGGLCAGGDVWQGETLELLAWRDNPRTQAVDGFANDEAFEFRYWDAQASEEITAEAHFTRWDEVFRARGHSRLDLTAGSNRAPTLSAIGNLQAWEGQELSLDLTASDPDRDELTFSAAGLPEGAALVDSRFEWTPSFFQAGEYEVTFSVSDGELSDSETITITVDNVNGPPELSSIGDQQTAENRELTIDLRATDPDDDALTFSADNLPAGAELEESRFRWTPSFDQSGDHSVTFIVTDQSEDRLTDSETITISVANTNRPPEFSDLDDQQTVAPSVGHAGEVNPIVPARDVAVRKMAVGGIDRRVEADAAFDVNVRLAGANCSQRTARTYREVVVALHLQPYAGIDGDRVGQGHVAGHDVGVVLACGAQRPVVDVVEPVLVHVGDGVTR
jgi:hypothetical protein